MYGTIGSISARGVVGRATGGDRHARASGSGITDIPRTGIFTLSALPMPDTEIHNTDVSTDINTDLPENSAPMIISDLSLLKWNTHPYTPAQDTQGGRPMKGIIEPLKVKLSGRALAVDCTSEEHFPTSYATYA